MGKQGKVKKMSMAEFMAGTPTAAVDLPSGPKQRGPDDDGSFRRNNHSMRENNRDRGPRNGKREEYGETGRGDEEQNWRRGGGVPQKDFSRERRRDDHGESGRGDEEQNWRRGSGVPQNREREDMPSRADGDSSWRSGRNVPPPRNDRFGRDDSYRSGSYRSVDRERPKLQLSKRTLPIEDKPPTESGDKKNDPFGGATAADTASKLNALEINEEEKRPMPINSRAAALESRVRDDPRDDNRSMRRLDDRGSYRNRDRSFRGRDDRVPYDNRDRSDRDRSDNRYDNRFDRDRSDNRYDYRSGDRGGYDNRSYRRDDRPYDRQNRPYEQDRRSNRGFDERKRDDESNDSKPSDRKEEAFPPLAPPPADPTPAPPQPTPKNEEATKEKAKLKEKEQQEAELQKIQKEQEEKKRQAQELEKQKEHEELLQNFLSLRDDELLQFCEENESELGNQIETLTFSLFKEYKDASWTTTHKSALQSLIPPDSMSKQLDVLFAIQKYCHSINFPKKGDKNAIHYYFELMLSEDIVSLDSFIEWKDDVSKKHELGKTKAIIQTMDWFAFLEEAMYDDEEENYEEEEYDEEF